jgi:hypothetical protein
MGDKAYVDATTFFGAIAAQNKSDLSSAAAY